MDYRYNYGINFKAVHVNVNILKKIISVELVIYYHRVLQPTFICDYKLIHLAH